MHVSVKFRGTAGVEPLAGIGVRAGQPEARGVRDDTRDEGDLFETPLLTLPLDAGVIIIDKHRRHTDAGFTHLNRSLTLFPQTPPTTAKMSSKAMWEVDPETRSKLLEIQKHNENNRCVDCGAPSPQWVHPLSSPR